MTADFTITRGTKMTWTITVPDDGSGLTFTGAKIYAAVRDIGLPTAIPVDDTTAMIHDDTIGGGLVITDAANRVFEWTIPEADTKNLAVGVYSAGFKWIPNGETDARQLDTVKTFQIVQDVVRAI